MTHGIHPTAATWRMPPADRAAPPGFDRGVRRTNLRVLAARPGRFEHHLTVVARAGAAQLEIATASEPLYFAHVNVSDEFALALPTGDDSVDRFPMRTFLADAASLADAGRYNHHVGDLVLHPLGLLHWPGRLRPPYAPFAIPPGMRRSGVSLVFCGSAPTPVTERPARAVSEGRAADAKPYVAPPPPMDLRDVMRDGAGTVARVGGASLALVVDPGVIAPARGAYVVVLETQASSGHHACDLVHVPRGASFDAAGVARALVFACDDRDVEPPPASWKALPAIPFAAVEDAPRGPLPVVRDGLSVSEADPANVAIAAGGTTATVPRYWLARMLFRVALHRPLLGYVETYGGFFFDDRAALHRFGVRDGGAIELAPDDSLAFVEALYRAVAPDGYSERLADLDAPIA